MTRTPRIIIAGTHSGVGKTTIAVGLMAAFTARSLRVQPFKAGPDYIDPSYHAVATGGISRNLDTWLLTERQINAVFHHASAAADVAVVEGVMGLFDGHRSTSDRGSTAELARWLIAPVILVVDASGMARSVAAMVRGYATFDPRVRVAGVILNRVSERHFQLLRDALRRTVPVPVLGYLPSDAALAIPERHLGLVPAQEDPALARVRQRLATLVPQTIDCSRVLRLATGAAPMPAVPWPVPAAARPAVTIGVARDRAFHFYYQENLDLLRAYGARLVEFSPLADTRLPDDLDALYLGGGFPERFAASLQQNAPMRLALRRAIASGVPTYAECGGLMYLAQRLIDEAGRTHAMVGILPGSIRMTNRLQHFGYATVTPRRATILADARDPIKGHEFHYSTWDHAPSSRHAAYRVMQRREAARLEGFARANLLASYVHVHFLTNTRWARGFVASAQRWKQSRTSHGGGVTTA
jgi:cobyrinic acid a,c-diamide synthase